jgi:hypothetical protein
MKLFAQHLKSIVVLTLLMAIAAVTIPRSRPLQAAGSAPVQVVNTPLPVSLTGTGTISGSVNAAQLGAWNVGVTNLPAVQLAPGTTVGISGNLPPNDSAKEAFVVGLHASTSGGGFGATVPLGNRYVIEYVSWRCIVGSGTSMDGWKLIAWLNGNNNTYYFRTQISAGPGATTEGLSLPEVTRIYADGGLVDGLSAEVVNGGSSAGCDITLSGHLVPWP